MTCNRERGGRLSSSMKKQNCDCLEVGLKTTLRLLIASLILMVVGATCAVAIPEGFARDFTYKQSDGAVDVMKGDKVIARYVYKDTPRPYLYPILSPAGLAITRNYPMKEVKGEPTDHPHHRSMWIGYGDANGVDFWSDTDKSGKMVQKSIDFDPIAPGPYWSIHTNNDWILPDGRKMASDERKMAFYSCKYGTFIVNSIRLIASVSQLKFNDTKEGFYAIRLAPSLTLKDGKGHILTSEGDTDAKAWGKRARWVDYTGEIDGKVVGVTMFDTTRNYGYPTYWHARDYGLLAANPFGGKAFTGDAKNESPMTLTYTDSKTFVYITLIHDGKLDAKTINALADDVAGSVPKPTTYNDTDGHSAKNPPQPMPVTPPKSPAKPLAPSKSH